MSAYDKAADLLTRREHTEKELKEKLSEKGFKEDEIRSAIDTLKSEGYLSDSRFAEVFIRSRLRKTAEGKPLILMRLTEKGVDRNTASEEVNSAWENEDYLPSLTREWCKLSRKYGEEKAEAKLRAKGFTSSEIRKAKERSDEDTEE